MPNVCSNDECSSRCGDRSVSDERASRRQRSRLKTLRSVVADVHLDNVIVMLPLACREPLSCDSNSRVGSSIE